jgi:hypothetical protein
VVHDDDVVIVVELVSEMLVEDVLEADDTVVVWVTVVELVCVVEL